MEYMAFPRLCALSEIAWASPQTKDFAGFVQRLDPHLHRLDGLKVNYCKKFE
jgi:hexosaminidase